MVYVCKHKTHISDKEKNMSKVIKGVSNAITKTLDKITLTCFKPYTSAIVTVGGSGTRMQTENGTTKQFIELGGIPIVTRTLKVFQASPFIDEIIVVAKADETSLYEKMISEYCLSKIKKIVCGGSTRQESVLNGFKAVDKSSEYVCIHDGVRCLITQDDIKRVIRAAYAEGCACAATKVYDTLKTADSNMYIESTQDRSKAWAAQTPQVFKTDLYRTCAYSAKKDGITVTDDCMLAESYGFKIKLVDCGRSNIKITTKEDLLQAESILRCRGELQKAEDLMRIGHGYDVHRLTENRRLILGGVHIPYERGLDGHSDADVLVHAIMDAVIGALGLGDIGLHFPDTSKEYKDIDSLILAKKTAELLDQKGYRISNIDATLVMQAPKVRPYIEQMQKNIASVYSVDPSCVNVKATTEEGLGFTGQKLGISAHAVCIITKK